MSDPQNPPAVDPNDPAKKDDPPQNPQDVKEPKKEEQKQQDDPPPFDASQVVIPPNPYEPQTLDPNISQVLPNVNQSHLDTSLFDPQNQFSEKDKQKTFLTLQKQNQEEVWKPYDFLFPAGILAQLVQVNDLNAQGFPWNDILNKLKLTQACPVVNLIGAKESNRGKFYAGVARACYNSDAVVIDSGIESGIEKYALRRGLQLIGVAPENGIKYPQINPTYRDPYELANGHTHLFLVNNQDKNLEWGGEGSFKNKLAVKLSQGKLSKKQGREPCQIVNVLIGDNDNYIQDLREAVSREQPIIVVQGSKLGDSIIGHTAPPPPEKAPDGKPPVDKSAEQPVEKPIPPPPKLDNEEIIDWLKPEAEKGSRHLFFMLDSTNSEDIAQYIHFLLSVTPYKQKGLTTNFQKKKKKNP